MRYTDAVLQLRTGKERKFILVGGEPFLKDQFILVCKSKYPEATTFYPDNANEALSVLSTEDLFQEERAIILVDFNKMKPDKFVSAIKSSQDILIFSLTEKADVKTKAMTEVIGVALTVQCDKLKEYGNDYPSWVASVIKGSGYTFEEEVDKEVYQRVGPSMFTLSSELNKLFIVNTESKHISLNDVNKYVSITANSTAYELLEDLLNQNVKSALSRFLSSLEDPGELVKFLSIYMEKFYRMLLLQEQKYTTEEIADIIGMSKFLIQMKYLPKIRNLGGKFIAAKFDLLCELEARMRSFKGDKNVLFEQFIYSFAKN
jgi:DNA polymerase III delta subunit